MNDLKNYARRALLAKLSAYGIGAALTRAWADTANTAKQTTITPVIPPAPTTAPAHAHVTRIENSPRIVRRVEITPPQSRPFSNPLRIPSANGLMALLRVDNPTAIVAMRAEIGRQDLFKGSLSEFWSYTTQLNAKQVSNPTLIAEVGTELSVDLTNFLGEETTIHWHGLKLDEINDGGGMYPVVHAKQYRYRFMINNRAGLYWYHPHPHHRTGAQVHKGMGGLLLVEDEAERQLRKTLGLDFGATEIPLIIHDKQVDVRNQLKYSQGEDDWIGNRIMVNWTPEPFLNVGTMLYRLRILNGSNARVYRLMFKAADKVLNFKLIGTDGGLLAKAYPLTEMFLAPAQRIDILVDFENLQMGNTVHLVSLAYDPMENDGGDGKDPREEHPGAHMMGEAFTIMQFNVTDSICAPRKIPNVLSVIEALRPTTQKTRQFRLHMDGLKWLINGKNYLDDMHAIAFIVKRNSIELWDIVNDTKSMPHPIHIHGFMFQVVRRKKSPPQIRRLATLANGLCPQDAGWMDTVLVWPGETVQIAVDFRQPFKGDQQYMLHCHNLEHEDQGMMLNFIVRA
jgi:blue copper oxidase